MTTREELNASFDRLSEVCLRVKAERDALLNALSELLDASPTSCEDQRLNDAQRKADQVLETIRNA